MQLKSLRLLVAVAETGSFGAAAKRLHTVQSNVTTHIKKLEEELSVKLIHRAGRVRPTSAGWALVEYAERMITAHDEAVSLFKGQVKACGRLRIGAMETTTALRLPPILAAYHAAQPDVDIQIKTGPTAELVELLLNGQVDCIFVAGRLEHGHYHSLKAFSEQLVLVGSTPMTQMPSSQALLTSAFLAFRQGCSYRQRIELLLAAQGVNAGRIFELGSLDAMLGCVAAGMGYTVLPRGTVEAHQHRFEIHTLELSTSIANIDTYFVAPKSETWTPALASFAETLRDAVVVNEPQLNAS
ncbi:LysR family transcriptional regulator [Halomonas sp. KX33721]|uniref:LysR family transcriptional regulator n=1 Tax=Halomonadaceae TaxID=28256 RepID=UPI00078595B3|nr:MULTISPECIES: LysR family transcriptional regulator [unclassified Halomonas]NGO89506.1 LysR family transcriptional regulator [Halomonas sp.]PHR02054.1 MAG: LysR family transcriptional regulator [Halomonas sp.]